MTNQSNYQNTQNYEINIDDFYNGIISEIDDIRGYVNISNPDNLKKLSSLKTSDFGGLSGRLQVSSDFQESRAHAFFRLIGFPVISSTNAFFNPGHDGIKYLSDPTFPPRQIKNKNKLDIINSPISGFYEFSIKRESYYNSTVKSWFNYQDINTTAYLLSSYNVRFFNSHTENYQNTFDFNIENQSYLVKLTDALNRSLLEYNDSKQVDKLIAKRYHYIFPLIVDPRLDLSAIKRPCVPFPFKASQMQVNETTQAKPCLLQTIIENRYSPENTQIQFGDYINQIIDFVKSNDSIKDEDLINKIKDPGKYGVIERQIFLRFINLINSMVDELIQAQSEVDLTSAITLYLPICGIDGPEAGIKSFNSSIFSTKFSTELDNDLRKFQFKKFVESINPQETNNTSDTLGEKIQASIDIGTQAFGNKINETVESLSKRKLVFDNKASDALRKIEIIMGEFSGLGLCDIIAILGGLYLVDKKYLLGLLDQDAFSRATIKLRLFNETQPTVEESLLELQKLVFDMYNIMQIIYTEKKQFGIRI